MFKFISQFGVEEGKTNARFHVMFPMGASDSVRESSQPSHIMSNNNKCEKEHIFRSHPAHYHIGVD